MKKMPLEERIYRHRCVEAWSMAVPWSGFPMKALVELAKPLGRAKYVRDENLHGPGRWRRARSSSGIPGPIPRASPSRRRRTSSPSWSPALYGKPLPKRTARRSASLPWKYGFKSVKSIVPLRLHRQAAGDLLGGAAGQRVRLLGQREPGGAASALEPGDRKRARQRRARADAAVQRLRRVRRRHVPGPGARAAVPRAARGVRH